MTATLPARPPVAATTPPRPRAPRWVWILATTGAASVATVLLLVGGYLLKGILGGTVDWLALLTTAEWSPVHGSFGALAMIFGTAVVSVLALALAVPVGRAAAIALTEYVPPRAARPLRTCVELLAAVPSIVYGLLGIMLIRPFIASVAHVPGGDSLMAAGIVLAIMIVPTVVAVSVDALSAVPARSREAGYSLGLTRREVIRSVVLPQARTGLRAAALLGLARALGEAIAVFLLVGRADGRLPESVGGFFESLVRPGQTLTTKLAGPEPVLAGPSGPHFAALCGLGVLVLVLVAAATVWSTRGGGKRTTAQRWRPSRSAPSMRTQRDRLTAVLRMAALVLPALLLFGMLIILVMKGSTALNPSFWLTAASGSSAGGIRDQTLGTLLLVVTTGLISLPLGLGAGVLIGATASARKARLLQTLTVVVGGAPTILLGLAGFVLLSNALGWGRSWLAGVLVLAPVVIPVVALATSARIKSMPHELTESAMALGLTRSQYIRSVVIPYAWPATNTGLLLGLARAAGETAPLLFTATVFFGAPALPGGVVDSPVQALPTHIFTLAQDSANPQSMAQAWSSALALVLITAVLLSVAVALRNRREGQRWTA